MSEGELKMGKLYFEAYKLGALLTALDPEFDPDYGNRVSLSVIQFLDEAKKELEPWWFPPENDVLYDDQIDAGVSPLEILNDAKKWFIKWFGDSK